MKAKTNNLKPFSKGNDPRRNTKGQPRKLPTLDKLLAEVSDDEWAEIIKTLARKAKKGDIRAAEVLLDRGYGKARQDVSIELPDVHIEGATPDQQALLDEVIRKLNEIENEDTGGNTNGNTTAQ